MTTTDWNDLKSAAETRRKAVLYRMVMKNHICPFGLKAKYLLKHEGYEVEDHWLTSREETDAFQKKHNVRTTPQVFINGDRIGGYSHLREHFGMKVRRKDETSYAPVIAIFSMAFVMALAVTWYVPTGLFSLATFSAFIAISMCLLAVQKLRDLSSFSNSFLGYDLLAQRYVPYAFVYPFLEALAGVLMLAGVLTFIAASVALFIGTVGAISVFKAVCIDKRELTCACVGGNSNVPLGFVSLTENVIMIVAGLWMLSTLLL